jgi:hypothetical protein
MPHIHLLLMLKKESRIVVPSDVDQYVSARIPYLPAMDDMSIEAKQQRRLWHLVTTSMLHDCSKACKGPELTQNCNKYFPKPYSAETILSCFNGFYTKNTLKTFNSADRYAQYTRVLPVGDTADFSPATDIEHQNEVNYRRLQPSRTSRQQKNYVCFSVFNKPLYFFFSPKKV